jgi:hypothetical protein
LSNELACRARTGATRCERYSVDAAAYAAAVASAGAAAFFSIKGMAVLFPGALKKQEKRSAA